MYTTIDPEAQALASLFRKDAERLWQTERRHDSILNMATAQFLSLAYVGHGKDHAVLAYLAEASNMGVRMGLFGVKDRKSPSPCDTSSAYQYAAWGVFNWIVYALLTDESTVICANHL